MPRFDHGQALHKSGRQALSPNEEWTNILQLFEPFVDMCVRVEKISSCFEIKRLKSKYMRPKDLFYEF